MPASLTYGRALAAFTGYVELAHERRRQRPLLPLKILLNETSPIIFHNLN
jgi:hypothetical protein